jgi:uncharacterized iron-regulated membrane protein
MRWNSFRSTLQTIHLWTGLVLSIPLVLIGLSGSALLVQREILAHSVPAASAKGERQSIAAIIAAAQPALPDLTAARVDLPSAAGYPAAVLFPTADRPARTIAVYVDPVSLKVLGTSGVAPRGPMANSLVSIHAFLMTPPRYGIALVGWIAVAMTFMGLSGLLLWWPRQGRWRNAFWIAKGAEGLRFNLDLHQTLGFWGLVVFLIMSVSGIYLAFPQTFYATVAYVLPVGLGSGDPAAAYSREKGAFDADHALAAALVAVQGARPVTLQLSRRQGNPIVVEMENAGFGPSSPRILATYDSTGTIAYVDDPRGYSLGDKFLNLQQPLHFATGMGWLWEIAVFVSGLTPLILAITGVNIWWLRRRARKRAPEPALAPERIAV